MLLISTLCDSRAQAIKILQQIPNDSIVLFPESVCFLSNTIIPYSIEKNLFIIYNQDIKINNKWFITMHGIDNGGYKFRVRKFNLWPTDLKAGCVPAKPEPYITIRGHKSALFICYDATKIFKMYNELIEHRVEILMITANWTFNFELIKRIIDFSMEYVKSLKCILFSNTYKMALIQTRYVMKIIDQPGFVKVEIKEKKS